MEEVKSKLNLEELRVRSTSIPYPHIKIGDLNKCVPLVITALEEGDIPLLGTLKGTTKIVKHISKSALNVSKLLRVTSISIAFSETDSSEVTSILDYMEVAQRWI
jgi:hypothetical protein